MGSGRRILLKFVFCAEPVLLLVTRLGTPRLRKLPRSLCDCGGVELFEDEHQIVPEEVVEPLLPGDRPESAKSWKIKSNPRAVVVHRDSSRPRRGSFARGWLRVVLRRPTADLIAVTCRPCPDRATSLSATIVGLDDRKVVIHAQHEAMHVPRYTIYNSVAMAFHWSRNHEVENGRVDLGGSILAGTRRSFTM